MDSKFVLNALKVEMKKAKMTYKELAKALKISEAGVKKLFGRSDISLSRIYQICKILGLSVRDLLNSSEADMAKEKVFSLKQEKFFAENPHYFHFFLRLAYEQLDPSQIQKEAGLSDKSIFKYLKKLDDLGLIHLHASNRVTIPDGIVARVNTQGTAMQNIKFKATQDFLKKFEKAQKDVKGVLAGGIFYLSEAEIENLRSDMMQINDTYAKRSMSNRSRVKDKLLRNYQTYTSMFMQAPGTLLNHIIEI